MYTFTPPARHSRPLDYHEQLYLALEAQGHVYKRDNVIVSASLEVSVPTSWSANHIRDRLRLAWQGLRFQQPAIALIVENGRKCYDVPTSSHLEDWTSQTLHIYDEDDAKVSFDSLVGGAAYVRVVNLHVILSRFKSQHVIELVLRTPHYFADAVSALNVLNGVIAQLANPVTSPSWGDEISRLPPSLEEAANSPAEATPSIKAGVQEFITNFCNAIPSLGLPCDAPREAKPGASRTTSLLLSKEHTSKLVKACKARGYTVAALALLSLVHLQCARLPPDSPLRQRNWYGKVPLNLRPQLPGDAATYASAPYVSLMYLSIDPNRPFDDTARELSATFKSTKNAPRLREELAEWAKQNLSMLTGNKLAALMRIITSDPAILARLWRMGGFPPASEASLNSLGIIDEYVRPTHRIDSNANNDESKTSSTEHLEVKNIRFAIEILTRQVTAYAWTWQGQLQLNACWNAGFYDDQMGQTLLREWRDIMTEQLEITLRDVI